VDPGALENGCSRRNRPDYFSRMQSLLYLEITMQNQHLKSLSKIVVAKGFVYSLPFEWWRKEFNGRLQNNAIEWSPISKAITFSKN
jgi:hypothetical protein